jgi:tetratricopeptide (TPR) repeat protein
MIAGLRKFNTSLFLIAAFLIASGCVTQKKKEDVGKVGKAYHNMTARYNGYYNADVLLNESILELDQQHQDNYNKILPIYKYVEADNPKAVADKLDNAIKKVSVVVNLHRVSHWTDDCYLVMGEAQFLKQDYEAAEETLEFLMAEFNPKEMAEKEKKSKAYKKRKKAIKKGEDVKDDGEKVELSKKEKQKLAKMKRKAREKERKQKIREAKKARKDKKKGKKSSASRKQPADEKANDKITEADPTEETVTDPNARPAPGSISLGNLDNEVVESDPENYFMKHRPAYQEGVLWLARTYIERENFSNAERLLNQLERSPSTFDDVRRNTAIAKAEYFLKQKKYDQAVEPLETAISMSNDRQLKARMSFILGQIHQQAKRGPAAYAAFEQVLKNSPPYEMEFTARLNLALAGVHSTDESVRNLERMLKEEKNKEFQDQIYYALAEIALERGDRKEAIKNLELSLQHNSRNIAQKAESYLLLADLYFEDQNFVDAKLYFDSTLLVMTNADERYARVSALASNLQGIAENIQIIQLQDSLLRISRMTDGERRDLAEKIYKKREEERVNKLREQAAAGANAPNVPKGFQPADAKSKSKFFAYDDKEVKRGEREFQRKWGSRELADNWRRANQQSIGGGEDAFAESGKGGITEEDINEILKDVPSTPEQIAAANRQIESALFALGGLYRDRIQNYPKSIEAFDELLRRYPETQYQLDALYYLYLSYKDQGDVANTQLYYDKIVNGYPNSNYARILQDPGYLTRVMARENTLTDYYDETYAAFQNRQYETVFERISKVGEKFGATNKFQPRFALLNAMCVGNLEGKDQYIESLKEVIAKYPEEPEAARAREIMRLLGEQVSSGPGQQRDLPKGQGQVGSYTVANDQLHYVIVVFKNDISLNDAKIIITDYNNKYHNLQKLRMNNIFLGDGDSRYPLIAIRRYKDKAEAMDYYNTVKKNTKDFLDKSKFDYEVFPIGQDNYRELLKTKNLDEYRTFFELNYLK